MIVSSVGNTNGDRFTIYPNEMADLYVKNGFRSANNGTYYSAFEWTAETFDIEFDRVYSTYDMADKINEGYYAIVSCSNGLFTTGGHFIVVCGRSGDTLEVYDPYLYPGKFDSYGRSGKCELDGNTVYNTVSNFKAYANAKAFFLFKNDESTPTPGPTPEPTPTPEPEQEVIKYVNTQSKNLNVRATPGGTIIHSLAKGTKVTVTEDSNGWSYIVSPVRGYVSSDYLADYTPTPAPTPSTSGNYKLKSTAYIFSNPDLTGRVYTYKPNTTITVLYNVNDSVDYIRVVATGRVGYINNKYYASKNSSSVNNTVGEYKKLKSTTYLYSNSNLTGTKYTYKANTTVKILKNVSSSVDYVYVVATGRYAYVNNNSYR